MKLSKEKQIIRTSSLNRLIDSVDLSFRKLSGFHYRPIDV